MFGFNGSLSRRQLLRSTGAGFGMLALSALLADEAPAVTSDSDDTSDLPIEQHMHHAARAKRCIFLFLPGGPSQVDTFDPKPHLTRDNGKPLPFNRPQLGVQRTGNLLASPWKFKKHGASGIDVVELLPHIAGSVDDLCVIRSMVADNVNHTGAALQMNTGEQTFSRPCLGSWLTYGLGSENHNLPGFVVISPQSVFQGSQLWSSSFLPAEYQGTWVRDLNNPIANLHDPAGNMTRQRDKLDLLRRLNELHEQKRVVDSQLEARIASFELAYRMQRNAPETFSINDESDATKKLYGLDDPTTETFGKQCLMARRLVEAGVRFVQVYDSATTGPRWDHHNKLKEELPSRCANVDRPIAGLLADLKGRGLLDDTLVVCGGEFGRTPMAQNVDGRDHHPFGFTMFLAGGGVKGGHIHGATDEYGFHAVQDKVHVHDLHATILHLMGIDHERLTYRYSGRDYRLTDVYGRVVKEIIA
ncbi:MAG TPA: DUF1501 domain-containing protein [Pirellulales bacterium]|jgi:hypothetical protein|nr:DUF1501 domain-containing protein [Pirellulales bacterium]